MAIDNITRWQDIPISNEWSESQGLLNFEPKSWDLESKQFIGMPFQELIPILYKESRFDLERFEPQLGMQNRYGGIINGYLKIFEPNQHELPGEERKTGEGRFESWVNIEILPNGEINGYNPLMDPKLENSGYAVALGSRVALNNLSLPGSLGSWGHFPMLDLIKPATQENVKYIINEITKRTGLQRFFILESSDHGMMMISPEIVDEAHLLAFWNQTQKISHFEIDSADLWIDPRWIARSQENFHKDIGINNLQVCGVLRATKAFPLKPKSPTIIATSY